MALITIRDDGTWDYGTPGEADHFLGDHDSCLVVLETDYQAALTASDKRVKKALKRIEDENEACRDQRIHVAPNEKQYWRGREFASGQAASILRSTLRGSSNG